MRVLYYTDSLRLGGKERQLVELLKGLKQRDDMEVLLVCMDRGEFYEPDVRALSIPMKYLFRKTRWDPLVIHGFYHLVREFKPDIIHTNSMMSSAYALPIAKLLGVPLINGSIRNCFQNRTLRWKVERALLSLLRENFTEPSWSGAAKVGAFVAMAERMVAAGHADLAIESAVTVSFRAWYGNPSPEIRTALAAAAGQLPLAADDPARLAILALADPVAHAPAVLEQISRIRPDDTAPVAMLRLSNAASARL